MRSGFTGFSGWDMYYIHPTSIYSISNLTGVGVSRKKSKVGVAKIWH